jgi:hypothetical protein
MKDICSKDVPVQLNAVDPWLESVWFQTLNLKREFLDSKFAFEFNLGHRRPRSFLLLFALALALAQTRPPLDEATRKVPSLLKYQSR